jgi:(S)-citramalyl-CoA lyase
MSAFLCRSLLSTCALQVPQYARALESGADAVILDLEDSVPVGAKDDARRLVLSFFQGQWEGCLRGLRINSPRTEAGLRDLLALLEHGARPDLLVIPKAESAEELRLLDTLLAGRMEAGLIPVIETPRGLHAVEDIARAVPRVRGLIFGAADFAASLGTTLAWEPLLYARARLVVAAAHAGVLALDAPCFRLEDPGALQVELEQGRLMGFLGKMAIHPRQVPAINAGFLPSPEMVAQAREILAQDAHGEDAIRVVGGQMIGPPFVRWARHLLACVEQASPPANKTTS